MSTTGRWASFVSGGTRRVHTSESRTPRWRDHHAEQIGLTERHNASTNLREWTRPDVRAPGCRDCPDTRTVPVAYLLEAFESGLPKIQL